MTVQSDHTLNRGSVLFTPHAMSRFRGAALVACLEPDRRAEVAPITVDKR